MRTLTFQPVDLTVDHSELGDETLDEFASNVAERGVTWRQRVYLLWLVLRNTEAVIAQCNALTISHEIAGQRRAGESMCLPFVDRHAEQRVKDIVRMVKNIMTKREGEA